VNEPKLDPLPEDVESLLRSARGVDPAPLAARKRVLAGVEAIVGPSFDGGGGAAGEPGRRLTRAAAGGGTRFGRLVPLLVTFGIGVGVGAVAMRAPPLAPEVRVVYVDRPVPAAAAPREKAEPADVTPGPPRVPAPSSTAQTPSPPPSAPRLAAHPEADLVAERRLLDTARGALEAEDGPGALQAIGEHARTFPSGVLAQEREAMHVRALLLVGRTADARDRMSRFRQRFPDSVLLPPLESAIAASPAP